MGPLVDSGPAILLAVLVTTVCLGAAVYLQRKARGLGPLRSVPPWDDVAPGPEGSLVLALAGMTPDRRLQQALPAMPSPATSRTEVEARVRSVVLLAWSERLRRREADLVQEISHGGVPEVPDEVRSFLGGEPAEARWRLRAERSYHGPGLLFGPWFRFIYLRRLTPHDRALRDLDLILTASELPSP